MADKRKIQNYSTLPVTKQRERGQTKSVYTMSGVPAAYGIRKTVRVRMARTNVCRCRLPRAVSVSLSVSCTGCVVRTRFMVFDDNILFVYFRCSTYT